MSLSVSSRKLKFTLTAGVYFVLTVQKCTGSTYENVCGGSTTTWHGFS